MKDIVSGIYRIVNLANGKSYIGSSVNIYHRWQGHLKALDGNCHHSEYLQRSWNKYGQECFAFEIIEYCPNAPREYLLEREQYYIDTCSPEFNIAKVAGSPLGVKRSDETKRKLHETHLGHRHTQEFKDALSERMQGHEYNVGRKASEETKLKMSIARTGRKESDETRAKISSIQKGKFVSEETRKRMSANSGRRGKPGHWTGATFSEERLKKMSESHLGSQHSEETKEKMSAIAQSRTPEYLLEIAEKKRATWKKKKELQEQQNE